MQFGAEVASTLIENKKMGGLLLVSTKLLTDTSMEFFFFVISYVGSDKELTECKG